ncbi:glycoside hydrolase family 88 protein [Pedobacter sp. AW31-3R]|uniref:glycoside hydrolase family 88 protein n=1 Tax=Pedobacter sp. AW31-3R TaxID=3445781 RepID=UPI003FA05445
MLKNIFLPVFIVLLFHSCQAQFNVQVPLDYCAVQAKKTLKVIPATAVNIPRSIDQGKTEWHFVGYGDWCSGFWPGTLWYLYESTGDTTFKTAADRFTRELRPLSVQKAVDHDLGFQVFSSFGKGYRLTGNPDYKKVILAAADTLATLFNPKVGTILSWPRSVPHMDWPQHNTIIDNMINLELLFWAARNGGRKALYDMAVSHARVTMKNHFRPDFRAYHAVVYDKDTGKKIKGLTHQGYADDSMWARGQAWAIYGYTMCYRESRDPAFLDFAEKVTDVYLKDLPADRIPYWDFNDPDIPNAPRDASAAAVVASGLLELSAFLKDPAKAALYRKEAEEMLRSLSSATYQSREKNSAFLLHSTGNHPAGSEIDASIIYADYYYAEALLRLKELQQKNK